MDAKRLVLSVQRLHPINENPLPIAEAWTNGSWTVDLALRDEKLGLDIEITAEDPSLLMARKKAVTHLRRTYALKTRAQP